MSLQILVLAHNIPSKQESIVVVKGNTRKQSEAIAKALGLDSAYGVVNPEEPGDYNSEDVMWERVDIDALYRISQPEITPTELTNLIQQGYTLTNHPSY
jgi:hypothetical protein